MQMDNLQELLIEEMKDIYNAEGQLLKALPRMAKKATNPKLKKAFETHTRETEGQIKRLEQAFEKLGEKARGKKCKAMEGIVEEGKEVMSEDMDDDVMDAALIGMAQKIEHYEIAGYGTARTFAHQLGYDRMASLLQETLDEEGNADKILTEVAEQVVNANAQRA